MDKQAEPPDQGQRLRIARELNVNMLVEAAAGTGKTTSMLGRMVGLLGSGAFRIETMAAVTFTRKAAAELRTRFQVALESAAREARGEEKDRLQQALAEIERCFIGTIHSFCARILRERPVEAGVDLDFEEIDDVRDERLRREAWNEYIARLVSDDPEGLMAGALEFGLSVRDLEGAFLRFADYPDVDEWPAGEVKTPPLDDVRAKVLLYAAHMAELAQRLPDTWGNDRLIPEYRRLPRVISHYPDMRRPAELMEILERFDARKSVVQREWAKTGRFTGEDAKRELERWESFREEVVVPVLQVWREARYSLVLRLLAGARAVYDDLRAERGLLNFQDLLMRSAALLRDKPHVRRYFRDRFTHVLVDEFQDTDPIQAEVILLLTSSDPFETDWRRCRPVPGSLFIVGDPKQSIYRFRRADIVTYGDVRDAVFPAEEGEEDAGAVVRLSANFRSTSTLIHWINRVFAPADDAGGEGDEILRFPPEPSRESPSYVALEGGREVDGGVGRDGFPGGVFSLTVPAEYTRGEDVVEYEADRIARTIRRALDSGLEITRGPRGLCGPVGPGDFMIVTRNTTNLSVYARSLQDYGIPHRVTGGSALNEVSELGLLHLVLRAVVRPDDPVALVAALRSPAFGVSDRALYAFKKAGGRFAYGAAVPDELPEGAEVLSDAMERLRKYAGWIYGMPPLPAFELVIEDMGLAALASSRPGGDVQAGSLAKAVELLRAAQVDTWTTAQLVDQLGLLVQAEEKYDGVSALSGDPPRVRVMNLHKVKGLEAPVVFLADPTGDREHEIELHVDRSEGTTRGFMAVYVKRGRWSQQLIAQPRGWDSIVEKERRFEKAEALRLRYVAATRAGYSLIITQRARGNGSNPWRHFRSYIEEELPDPGVLSATSSTPRDVDTAEVARALEGVSAGLQAVRAPTYSSCGAKEYALARETGRPPESGAIFVLEEAGPVEAEGSAGGIEWGTVVHALLELAAVEPHSDLLGAARTQLLSRELDPSLAPEAEAVARRVMGSGIWKRSEESERRLAEVPFFVPRDIVDGPPAVVRGAIDLVFKESDGWVLVDYKTDRVEGAAVLPLAEKYAPQVRLYAEVWEECAGEPVKEALLYFLFSGTLVRVERG